MKVVVGLGNPGKKYEGTRHNIGFVVLSELARLHAAPAPRAKFEAELTEINVGRERVMLLAPQTYMNLSGRSVRQVADFYQLPADAFLVVCDDINLPVGKVRLRRTGSAGGQKGLDNILRQLNTQDVARLRLGVGAPPGAMDAADYVLGRIGKQEAEQLQNAVVTAVSATELWVEQGIEAAMNRYNAGTG